MVPPGVPAKPEVTDAVKVTDAPRAAGSRDEPRFVVVGALVMRKKEELEVLAWKLPEGVYTNEAEKFPAVRKDVGTATLPLVRVKGPEGEPAMVKRTVPVGVPPPEVTTAVKVRVSPTIPLVGLTERVDEVGVRTSGFTVTLRFPELIRRGASATKFAKTVVDPTGRLEVAKDAVDRFPVGLVGVDPIRVSRPAPSRE
jgi:hypothetical protein